MAKKSKKKSSTINYVWAALRISLGSIFAWAFIDKLWGLGFTTCRNVDTNAIDVMCDKAWAAGGSPTMGFLKFGTKGPFEDFYASLAGNTFIDWLFMVGLAGIGLALLLGIGIKIAATTGSILMFLMWTAVLPPEHHPFMDDHIMYILVLIGICLTNKDQVLGFGEEWSKTSLVKKYPILQ